MAIDDGYIIYGNKTIICNSTKTPNYTVSQLYKWLSHTWNDDNALSRQEVASLITAWLSEKGYNVRVDSQCGWSLNIVNGNNKANLYVESNAVTIEVDTYNKIKSYNLYNPDSLQKILEHISVLGSGMK